MSKYQKVRNSIFMVSVIFFLLTPVFLNNSAHFNWGFGFLMLIVLPLLYLIPILLLVELIKQTLKGSDLKINLYLLLSVIVSWGWSLINFIR